MHLLSSNTSPHCFPRNSSIYLSTGHFIHIKRLHFYTLLWSNSGITRHDLFNTLHACWFPTCPAWIYVQALDLSGHPTIKLLQEAISAAPVSFAKSVLAQFAVLGQFGSPCKACCGNALKYKQLSPCQDQYNGHTWTPLQCAIATKLLGSLETISQPQHLPPRAPRAREEERSPPKVYAKGGEGEKTRREKKENHLLVTESEL